MLRLLSWRCFPLAPQRFGRRFAKQHPVFDREASQLGEAIDTRPEQRRILCKFKSSVVARPRIFFEPLRLSLTMSLLLMVDRDFRQPTGVACRIVVARLG